MLQEMSQYLKNVLHSGSVHITDGGGNIEMDTMYQTLTTRTDRRLKHLTSINTSASITHEP